MGLVDTSEDNLALALLVIKEEGKDGLVNQLLIDHVVKGRDDAVHGNAVVSKTENTVKAAEGKGKAGLASSLGKVLALDLDVADSDDIVGDETLQAAGSIVDLKRATVLLVGRGLGRVVLRVKVASNATTALRGNPQVGAASVQNNLEGLRRGTDGDLGEV